MIKTQELKTQIEELTKQNDMMLMQLEQMKQIISGGASGPSSGDSNQTQQGASAAGGQAQGNQAQQAQGGAKSQSGGGGNQAAKLANELLQIKGMVTKLEEKTSQYVSSQSSGTLTDKDVVNLVLVLINGMVDWASDFVSSQAASSGQKQ
ncbi:hypothetical protein SD70_09275 [Gordoniibacillus kamchatkensis]|uniref:Spore coat protein n=1 Tax=Gordoniibacillus kamchatkensis TaxID=1590651 RepID=A0ABR5AK22_9BACL|nr:hypothetical protein [Paenibacillus sp. VKM B-2647]KIL41198.1 hypothetical protein SD70_09275 [Paenibacillus sp. VKM B-2647]